MIYAVICVTLVLGLLVWATLTRRVRLESCCAPADPRRDLRMRAAFEDDAPTDHSHMNSI